MRKTKAIDLFWDLCIFVGCLALALLACLMGLVFIGSLPEVIEWQANHLTTISNYVIAAGNSIPAGVVWGAFGIDIGILFVLLYVGNRLAQRAQDV